MITLKSGRIKSAIYMNAHVLKAMRHIAIDNGISLSHLLEKIAMEYLVSDGRAQARPKSSQNTPEENSLK